MSKHLKALAEADSVFGCRSASFAGNFVRGRSVIGNADGSAKSKKPGDDARRLQWMMERVL
ncbi:hypothetical protein RPMA_05745 [Tardiphaga alba]|uniref:Uncharacterized protein n=1 Tax=Tardiphaga alba TaxID=340268 RepID=A0ABX8A7F5_9BRAD|nr:hypothetical protein [Tardiphaga alba]QUS38403.1 hypothetical protein RPMA_05745 [Tardiphaga alba]